MKNLVAYVLIAITLISGAVTSAPARKPDLSQPTSIDPVANNAAFSSEPRTFTVGANSVRYHTYSMTAGERVQIILSGDGSTDLDLYVYSSEGVRIDSQEGATDYEVSNVVAYRSGTITIKVVNRGSVYNAYDISVY